MLLKNGSTTNYLWPAELESYFVQHSWFSRIPSGVRRCQYRPTLVGFSGFLCYLCKIKVNTTYVGASLRAVRQKHLTRFHITIQYKNDPITENISAISYFKVLQSQKLQLPHINLDIGWHLSAMCPRSCSMRFLSFGKPI